MGVFRKLAVLLLAAAAACGSGSSGNAKKASTTATRPCAMVTELIWSTSGLPGPRDRKTPVYGTPWASSGMPTRSTRAASRPSRKYSAKLVVSVRVNRMA